MEDKNRICARCLIYEMAEKAGNYVDLKSYIERIDEKEKATEEDCEKRLMVCKDCDMLLGSMCRHCGCYVELRAAVEHNSCPVDKW